MSLHLTKESLIGIFESAIDFYRKFSGDIYPSFHVETWYAECFRFSFPQFPVNDNADIIPVITQQFKNALDQSSGNIYKTLDQHQPAGHKIAELISGKQFILKKYLKAYNQEVNASSPELERADWMLYNHWVLANAFWQGFLLSRAPGFQYVPPENASGPLKRFLKEASKPLQGMNMKAREAGLPLINQGANAIYVNPYAGFAAYFGKKKKTTKG